MLSANKKHGNVADIEILGGGSAMLILEAWDAKYGKTYLRDELEELDDKLEYHDETSLVGFVTDAPPDLREEISTRVAELEDVRGVEVKLLEFGEWVRDQAARCDMEEGYLAFEWLRAFTETLCQRRRDIAPVDEPCLVWVEALGRDLEEFGTD